MDVTADFLTGAILKRANLTGANLTHADLTDANLTNAKLTGARWPWHATVPEGWQRDTDSGLLKRADTKADGAATDLARPTITNR